MTQQPASDESQLPIVLHPLPRAVLASRLGDGYLALVAVAAIVAGVLSATPTPLVGLPLIVLGVALLALALVLILRAGMVAVTLTADTVVLRSQLRTRVVPRTSVQDVSDEPRLVWADSSGRKHRAWLTGLSMYRDQGRSGRLNDQLRADLQEKLHVVRTWARLPVSAS